jgi:hypothetical protein
MTEAHIAGLNASTVIWRGDLGISMYPPFLGDSATLKRQNWVPYIVKHGNLLSGQNPASTAPTADAVLVQLG